MEDTELDPLAPTRDGASTALSQRMLKREVHSKLFATDVDPVRIGRFEVLRKVGEGGMGAVYLATDPELERRVAIKLLRNEAIAGHQGRQRLKREARAMAKLADPNVVHVYEVGEHSGQVFVAMEYIEGATLRVWLQAQRPLQDILEVFTQAARGLAAAHRQGLVHRDFKPDNLLVGADGRARVVDFGLARPDGTAPEVPVSAEGDDETAPGLPHAEVGLLTLTATGALIGTPAYMAPEQFEGRPTDGRTDQFALCVTLYEALFGHRPFQGKTISELSAAVLAGTLPEALGPPHIPAVVERVLRRGLAVDPSDRYDSMAQLGDELVGVSEAKGEVRSTGKYKWAFGVAVVLVAAGGLTAATVLYRPPSTPAPPAIPPSVEDAAPRAADARALTELGGREVVTAAAARAIRCDGDICGIERRFVRGLRAAPAGVRTQARTVAKLEGSQVVGLKLYGVTEDSLPGRLGFRNGDVVSEIAGRPARDWGSVEAELDRLSGLDVFDVRYERQGAEATLHVRLSQEPAIAP